MKCASCGSDNPEGQRFCGDCGAALAPSCPACGAANPPGKRFCGDCGTALTAETPAAPRLGAALPEAERRQLTVLFCDLVGSTALSTALDPEDMRDVLRAYQDACAGVIGRYDGYLAKFMGDGVFAYFGYPLAHEDDAERAVNAGLGIVEAVGALGRELHVRIGVATGTVAVGDIVGIGASEEAAIVGEAPNLAARLQEIAGPDTVVIGESTHALLGGLFEARGLGRRALKGFAEPVGAWAVTGRRRTESRFEAIRGEHLTELVGRAEEMEILLRRWERAKAGEGQVVLISGEPGIGKSRLARELQERIAGDPHYRLRYQCSPFHANSALHPVIEQLERAARFETGDNSEIRLEKLEGLLSMSGRPVEGAASLLATLLSVPGGNRYPPLAMSPQRQKELTLRALVEQLTGLAERRPVLFVFEDAHWIDPTTLELLELTVERVPEIAALMLITFRPEFAAPWTGRPRVTPMILNRLERGQSRLMVARLWSRGGIPKEIRDRIAERTDGVPLFIEELTKSVLEAALGSPDRTLTIDVPATIQDSLEARLDRLGPAKEIAQAGAVIGRTFDYGLLSRIVPTDERTLAQLVGSGLVTVRGTPPEATYAFSHALIQDAAYGSLLRSRRAEMHRLIAEALERDRQDIVTAQPEVLAHHFTEAGAIATGVDYWLQAGRASLRRSAVNESIAHLRKGLEVVQKLEDVIARKQTEIPLWLALASTLRPIRGPAHPEVEQAYANAYELCRETSDTVNLFPALYGLSHARFARGDFQSAQTDREELIRLAETDSERIVVAQAAAAEYHMWLGHNAEALTHAKRGADAYDITAHSSLAITYGRDFGVLIHVMRANANFALGYPDQARQAIRDLIAHGNAADHPYAVGFAYSAAAIPCVMLRDVDTALECAEEGLRLAIEQGFLGFQALCKVTRGWARAVRELSTEAVQELQDGFEQTRTTGNNFMYPLFDCLLSEVWLRAGRAADALEMMDSARAAIDERGESHFQSLVLTTKADALLALEEPDEAEAERSYSAAIDVARAQSAKSWELRAAIRLARMWHDQGRTAEARDLLAPVYGWFTEGFETADLKEAKALLDEVG